MNISNAQKKIVLAVIISLYFFYYAATSNQWHFIDTINLIFHEAGHTITFFLGQFISIASGSIFQVLVPALCCLYFYNRQEKYAASLLLFWVGQSIINISVYARDSIVMQLDLLGGDSVIHDWNYLLTSLHVLKYTPYIADGMCALGLVVIVMGLCFAVRTAVEE